MSVAARPVRVATRGSRLARWQAERVARLIGEAAGAAGGATQVELVVVATEGDRRQDVEIHAMGGTGVFVKEVQQAVLEGRADVAVHSAKDLPSLTPHGLVIAAVPERADARDALVGAGLDDVPTGGRVGTGSVRRRAQLAAARPDLGFAPLRGNIETRLRKAAELDAVVVAVAALERLGLAGEISEILETSLMLPQVGQGALAVECRSDDEATLTLLRAIDDAGAHRAVDAERAFLAGIGGGCDLPVGALALCLEDGSVLLDALLATVDGRIVLRAREEGDDPAAIGAAAAARLIEMADFDFAGVEGAAHVGHAGTGSALEGSAQ